MQVSKAMLWPLLRFWAPSLRGGPAQIPFNALYFVSIGIYMYMCHFLNKRIIDNNLDFLVISYVKLALFI